MWQVDMGDQLSPPWPEPEGDGRNVSPVETGIFFF